MVCFVIALSILSAEQSTFQDYLREVSTIFQAGQWEAADQMFGEMERVFGQEPEYLANAVQQELLPRRGWTALAVGEPQRAEKYFADWLEKHQGEIKVRRLVTYGYAEALEAQGMLGRALVEWQGYLALLSDDSAKSLVLLRMAGLHRQGGDPEAALEVLRNMTEMNLPDSLRSEVLLLRMAIANETNNQAEWTKLLENPGTALTSTEPIEWVRLWWQAALNWLEEGQPDKALQVMRLLPCKESLLRGHTAIEDDTALLATASPRMARQSEMPMALNQHLTHRLNRLRSQRKWLEENVEYESQLLLLYGQTAFDTRNLYQAQFLFRRLAEGDGYASSGREQAHYRWLLTLHALEKWNDSHAVAATFQEQYPASGLVPHALFITADVLYRQARHDQALELLRTLQQQWPKHDLLAYWKLTCGFIELNRGEWQKAVLEFQEAAKTISPFRLNEMAQLWEGVAWYQGDHYVEAIDRFNPLLEQLEVDHPQRSEALYRRCITHRALENDVEARADAAEFLKLYPDDYYTPELHAVMGDLLMGAGELDAAIAHFKQVPPERAEIYIYATFQTGKAHRARKHWGKIRAHFAHYITVAGQHGWGRRAEALKEIADSHREEGQPAMAWQSFIEAWQMISGEMASGDTVELLHLGKKLWRYQNESSGTFEDWLQIDLESAIERKESVKAGRILVYQALHGHSQSVAEEENSALTSLVANVPIESLDYRGLALTGLHLLSRDPIEAEVRLRKVMEASPGCIAEGESFYGLALLAGNAGASCLAIEYLESLRREFPMHPKLGPATLLLAKIHAHEKRYPVALALHEELLQLRSMRGRIQAEALAQSALVLEQMGEMEKAYAYWQRLYTLHRAQEDLRALALDHVNRYLASLEAVPGEDVL